VAGGPAAYLSTLPLAALRAAIVEAQVPAYISDTAGTYLCNQVLYATLHGIAARGWPTRAGFVHLPLLPAMVARSGADSPSMALETMARGLDAILGVLAADPGLAGPDQQAIRNET
jgi:pyroglutamyl-peptidase